MKEGKAETS